MVLCWASTKPCTWCWGGAGWPGAIPLAKACACHRGAGMMCPMSPFCGIAGWKPPVPVHRCRSDRLLELLISNHPSNCTKAQPRRLPAKTCVVSAAGNHGALNYLRIRSTLLAWNRRCHADEGQAYQSPWHSPHQQCQAEPGIIGIKFTMTAVHSNSLMHVQMDIQLMTGQLPQPQCQGLTSQWLDAWCSP